MLFFLILIVYFDNLNVRNMTEKQKILKSEVLPTKSNIAAILDRHNIIIIIIRH